MDEEETDRKKDEEELNRKKALRISLVGLLLSGIFMSFVCIFYDFFKTCICLIIGGTSVAIIYLIYYFSIKVWKQKSMKYFFYLFILITAWIYIVSILDACFPECP